MPGKSPIAEAKEGSPPLLPEDHWDGLTGFIHQVVLDDFGILEMPRGVAFPIIPILYMRIFVPATPQIAAPTALWL